MDQALKQFILLVQEKEKGKTDTDIATSFGIARATWTRIKNAAEQRPRKNHKVSFSLEVLANIVQSNLDYLPPATEMLQNLGKGKPEQKKKVQQIRKRKRTPPQRIYLVKKEGGWSKQSTPPPKRAK